MRSESRDFRLAEMLSAIEADYAYAGRLSGLNGPSPRVMAALAEVPREEFVPAELRGYAFDNRALPIEDGQTISQPFVVALMTDLLRPQEDHVMLEVGTGSGYQAAVLSRVVRQVYSMEIIPDLAQRAVRRFQRLGYRNIEVRQGDGHSGWPEHAPYDGIIVTAAAPRVPPTLVEQLKPGARLVIPVNQRYYGQELMLVEKNLNGTVTTREVLGVAFVPMTGGSGKAGSDR
jgi:protein-L-isoaspartate(D-aspartate) O-methyltransferase